jgi:hypothetical protein
VGGDEGTVGELDVGEKTLVAAQDAPVGEGG